MKFTDINVRLIKDAGKLKAVVSVVIDDAFVIHDIKVIHSEQGYFISMPSRKTQDGKFKDIAHPINTDTRNMLQELVLEKFNEECEKEA